MPRSEEAFEEALKEKKVPILTLDNKWHRLFTQTKDNPEIKSIENELNELLKRQGKLNVELKEIKKIKSKLMDEIVKIRDENGEGNKASEKKLQENKRLIAECNDKMDSYQDELKELPREIEKKNHQLMLVTMDICYEILQNNEKEIIETEKWVANIRIELKKRLVKKQKKEIVNQELYTYMHNIFGAEVINIFDMQHDPGKKPLVKKKENE